MISIIENHENLKYQTFNYGEKSVYVYNT